MSGKEGKSARGKAERFKILKEDWNEYELEDGTIVRVKLAVRQIIRMPGENPKTGEPFVNVWPDRPVVVAIPPGGELKVPQEPKEKNTNANSSPYI